MNDITPIRGPLNNVNDDSVFISAFLVEDMSLVAAETEIMSIETSKAAINLTTPVAGYVHFLVATGEEVPNGAVLAIVASEQSLLLDYSDESMPRPSPFNQTFSKVEGIQQGAAIFSITLSGDQLPATLGELLLADAELVSAGAPLCRVRNSAGIMTIKSPADGYIFWLNAPYSTITEQPLAFIAANKTAGEHYRAQLQQHAAHTPPRGVKPAHTSRDAYRSVRISKPAAELLAGIQTDAAALGLTGLVRAGDVIAKTKTQPEITNNAEKPMRETFTPDNITRKTVSKSKKAEIRFLSSANSEAVVSQVCVLVPSSGFFRKAAKDSQLLSQFSARIIFEVSRLLQKYPDLQSVYENGELYQYTETNIGYALCVDKGLKVPVFRACNTMSLDEIIAQKDAFIEKYILNTLSLDELEGGTFTITDLSSMGSWLFNPVLNYRQSCILGIGGVNPEASAYPLLLAFDHRVTDGMTATLFLNDLKQRLYSHERLLLPDPEREIAPAVKQNNALEPDIHHDETPYCTNCYRDVNELTDMDHYLVQTIDKNGDTRLVCTICLLGW
jgi:pyruvate dehydrogenase E2 component (dihydrolipoamide acetyltransferase)